MNGLVEPDRVASPVDSSVSAQRSPRPMLAAGADEAEGVAVERVAADPSVLDTEPESVDSNGVESQGNADASVTGPALHERESLRQSRLALWQAQR